MSRRREQRRPSTGDHRETRPRTREPRPDVWDPEQGVGPGLSLLFKLVALVVAVVALRLVWLQVIDAARLTERAEAARTNAVTLTAKRGTIYDRDGNVLAISQDCQTIYCNPEQVTDASQAAELIALALGGDEGDYEDLLTQDSTFVYVSRKVDEDVASGLSEALGTAGIEGVYFLADSKRVYPYGDVARQVLGIVGTDGAGVTGVEALYDDVLSGTDGEMIMETGAGGTPIAGASSQVVEAQDGTDIVLSLDVDIQRVAEEELTSGVKQYSADSGSAVVTDPTNGEVLAICSTPLYDPDDESTIEEGATSLKPVSSSYEPGSIAKILTTAIALESGSATMDSSWTIPGYIEVGTSVVTDDDGRSSSMEMDLREILRRSSNVGAAFVAEEVIGAETFSEGFASFGIGRATGIDFPGEVSGIVKTLDEYDDSTLGSMAFGQGLAIPMIQMVKAAGTIANGGVPTTPHLLVKKGDETVDYPEGDRVISEKTASEVTDMMVTVVEEGTGTAAQVEGYTVAGKTGTGEMASEEGGYVEDKFTSSLLGFANADDPRVLVYVGINGTAYHGSESAAPVFSAIMGEAVVDMGVQPEG